jgi:hypothetical protein
VQLVVLFLGSVPHWISPGPSCISDLHRTLRARGVALRLAETHGEVRDALRRIDFERVHGPLASGQTVDLVMSEWHPEAAI